ncbi:polyprenyl synthetase family protein [Lactococcus garvieae]|uniref:Heptaprenyl diphosphate synthase component II n=1 Tax=Lactococcus garvieae DCC43 TaxID=1231377 RepID=K2PK31_9LACT|nr:polyprenyl synthetase family protein [Lactococcus garvieae]EKF51730.1 Heptaprenyl diphosphate synthase component II [Lactococcus garvieae DCC43]QPS70916.1 polyprenyl synthetase family protein [Lactococcus garvieae]
MLDFWQNYPEIREKLIAVQTLMTERLAVNNTDIRDALQKFTTRGGKMVRPALFFLFSGLIEDEEQDEERLIKIAASLELLHSATLIHDDIIDDSPLRRGLPSVEAQFGKDVAVYTGDFIYTVYFELLCETMAATPFLPKNAKSMKKILQGELTQMQAAYNKENNIRRYLKAISGKTAELLSLACLEGAYFSGGDKQMQRSARKIGLAIGLAFQIYDDVLNFTVGLEEADKPILTDFRQGIYTLPLLLAKDEDPSKVLPYLAAPEKLSREECVEFSQLVADLGGITGSLFLAKHLTDQALLEIKKLPESRNREILIEVTQSLLQRNY